MNIVKLVVFLVLVTQIPSSVAETGKMGFSADVTVEGFFNPKITKATIGVVQVGSSAEAAGLISGQRVLAINGCEIPGCSARKAKVFMKVVPGETLVLLVQSDGCDKRLVKIRAR